MKASAMWEEIKAGVYLQSVNSRQKKFIDNTRKLDRGQVMESLECHIKKCGCPLWVFKFEFEPWKSVSFIFIFFILDKITLTVNGRMSFRVTNKIVHLALTRVSQLVRVTSHIQKGYEFHTLSGHIPIWLVQYPH